MNKKLLAVFTGLAVLSLVVSLPNFSLAHGGRGNNNDDDRNEDIRVRIEDGDIRIQAAEAAPRNIDALIAALQRVIARLQTRLNELIALRDASASPLPLVALRATLRGANEVPPVASAATGRGTFVLDRNNNTLSFNITFSGLSSVESGAHIHGPAAVGTNAGILFALPAGSPKTGVWNYGLMANPEAIEADILAGRIYVNVHSLNFPAGEIRGQIFR